MASLVYVVTAGLAVVGGLVAASGWPNFGYVFFGLLLVGIAYVMRPRFARLDNPVVSRESQPALYGLVARVTSELRSPPIDAIVLDHEFNASFGQYGLNRRRILFLGLPLFMTLGPQERVALLGHEIGHGVNRDPARGFLIGGAILALAELYDVLMPDALLPSEEGLWGILRLPFRLAMALLAGVALAGAFVLSALMFRDSQRAEYRADALGARLAGTAATLSTLEKLHFAPSVERMTWVGETRDILEAIRRKLASAPPRELERIRRAERLEGSRLDYMHPPTSYRVDLLASRPVAVASLVLPAGESDRIDQQLQSEHARIQQRILAEYEERLGG
jgi:Zn-dependent protease with chaperone function